MDLDKHGVEICLLMREGQSDPDIAHHFHVSVSKLRYWRERNGLSRLDNSKSRPDLREAQRLGKLWQARADDLVKERAMAIAFKTRLVRRIARVKAKSMLHEMNYRQLQKRLDRQRKMRIARLLLRIIPFGSLADLVINVCDITDYVDDISQLSIDVKEVIQDLIAVGQEIGVPSVKTTVNFLKSSAIFSARIYKTCRHHDLLIHYGSPEFFSAGKCHLAEKIGIVALYELNDNLDKILKKV